MAETNVPASAPAVTKTTAVPDNKITVLPPTDLNALPLISLKAKINDEHREFVLIPHFLSSIP